MTTGSFSATHLSALATALADRYRVQHELGAGGMARVYLAHDIRHARDVAIKVLHPDLGRSIGAERFSREIRLAATLSHPHILPLFDSGEAEGTLFYVMPVARGESLRDRLEREGRLAVDEAVRIAGEVAGALEHAHRQGIIHRDIKPENILLQDGHAVVADFGIGKAMNGLPGDVVTETGLALGTPAYMSPEQATGEAVDGRSDLYALACVLHEMLLGEPPFTGPTAQAVIAKRFVQAPPDASLLRDGVTPALGQAIVRALARDAVDRFDTVADFAQALAARADALAPAPVHALAVLPFVNLGGGDDDQYFSDGLSEDLINVLTTVEGLQVASRTSAFRFRGGDVDVRAIGAQLNVGSVLEGSVRRAGARLRVTAQLVNVATGFQLWSQRYDREMTDVFALQDEIVAAIVQALVPTLLGHAPARATRGATENLAAYELYLKGRAFWHQRSPATVRVAIQHFEQAIALDAGYALAYCGLADCYGLLRVYGWSRREDDQPRAWRAVERAMALAPDLWEANYSRAFYQFAFERDWRAAGTHFERTRALNPKSSLAQAYVGLYWAMVGDASAVRAPMKEAVRLDPLSSFTSALAAIAHYIVGDFDRAEALARRGLELQGDFLLALWAHGLALSGLGRHAEGVATLERACGMSRAPIFVCMLGQALARAGRRDEAASLLAELDERAARGEYVPASARLGIQVGLGDVAGVRRELAACLDEVTPPFSFRVTSGVFIDALRDDPAIAGLLDAWLRGEERAS